MERNNYKSFILVLMLMVFSQAVIAQEKGDTLSVTDAIIRVDGAIVYGKVTEINPTEVKCRLFGVPEGVVIILPRDQVYAISFSNHTTQVITPRFGTTETKQKPAETGSNAVFTEKADTSTHDLSYNMAHGSLKIGLGFAKEYTSFNGLDVYNNSPNTPSFYMAYQFNFSKRIITGVNFAYASINYTLDESSDYDGVAITKNIEESIVTGGVFGRYDILEGFVKPYILVGLNINYSNALINGDLYLMNEGKHILTTSEMHGFKPNFVGRVGLDLMITRRLGLYSDIGVGPTLVQVGVIFRLK